MQKKNSGAKRILVVGQTPPPYGGQAVMIEELLKGNYPGIELVHVRLSFSKGMEDVGKFGFRKLWHLAKVICSIYYHWFRCRTSVLYYPPGGYNKIPLYRDMLLLASTRWLFKKTIFHFHASGTSQYVGKLPSLLNFIYRKAFFFPDITIRITALNPPDGVLLKTKNDVVVHNGISDHYHPRFVFKKADGPVTILFIGNVRREKGVECLFEAARILKRNFSAFQIVLMGQPESSTYQQRLESMVQKMGLQGQVAFVGVLRGEEKLKTIAQSDIFCLPSHLETFGLVCVEAMQFEKPVVASNIPALTEVVRDGETGYLFEDNDAADLAGKIEILCTNEPLRKAMGVKGRQVFLENYTQKHFTSQMNQVFQLAVN